MSLMMLVSCNKDKENSKEAVFTANIEQHTGQQGRTAINPENGQVKWLAGDKIVIANGEGETAQFTLQSGAGTTEGTFRTTGEFEMDAPFTAVYPQTATLNGTTATFNLPATQTLAQTGTFANGANPMAAYGTDENLYFRNLCGGLDVRLLGDNIHVSGIRITGNESEKLNGTFAVDCSANEPAIMASQGTNGTNVVTLNCDAVLDAETATEFFIVLPVGALANGFTMEVLDGTEVICTKQLETNLAQIVRNEVKRFNPLLIGETPTPIELPDVVTNQVTDITTTAATVGGEIVSDGGSAIIESGVCYKTGNEDWTCVNLTATNNAFSTTLTDLTPNTTYTVRAYATNEGGTGYGAEVTFTTDEEIVITVPTVTTSEVTEITTTTAIVGGSITSAGNGTISESGICYKTGNEDWTCVNLTATNNAFTTTLTDLTPNTTYTVRAYATNEEGTGYGEEVTFTTEEEIVITAPTVTTNAVTDITTNSALVGGAITNDGNGTISESGICYKTGNEDWTCVSIAATNNAFSMTLTGLTANTTYTVRAYATNEEGTGYGEEVSFTTLNDGGGDTHEYVDLGLPSGLLWATCNVGADTPEGYGDYFAWGETTPKDTYNWSTYQHCNGSQNTLTKYCNNSGYGYNGFTDNLTTLLPEDDAATANWGNGWRMPTLEEWQELYNYTSGTWTTQNGVYGWLFTAANGNSLFLPAAGYRGSSSLLNAGSYGGYWSSSLYADGPRYAWDFYFFSGASYISGHYRDIGQSVRPVRSSGQK